MHLFLLFISISLAQAESIDTAYFDNQNLQKRYQQLVDEIRCPVCQGQSISGSNAPLAQDLRKVVKKMLKNSKTNEQIFTFMRERYGDFVVFKPPMNNQTYLLWFAPPIFIFFAVMLLLRKKPKVKTKQVINTTKAKDLLND